MKSEYLTPEQVAALKSAAPVWAWLPFWVSLETGLRVGDVVSLRRASLQDDGLHYRAQKTGKTGVAPISARLRASLTAGRGTWLFPSPKKRGAHLTRQAVWYRIKAAAEKAGIDPEGISPHSMRKVFAVELYREKGFRAVQTALQHSNSATTEIYAFSDWATGDNADKPLTRRDLSLIVKMAVEALGDGYRPPPESTGRKRKQSRKGHA